MKWSRWRCSGMSGRRPAACSIQQAFIKHRDRARALLTASDRSVTATLRLALCVHAKMARTKKSSQPQPERSSTRRNRHEPRDKPPRSEEFKKGSEEALKTAAEQRRFPIPSAEAARRAPAALQQPHLRQPINKIANKAEKKARYQHRAKADALKHAYIDQALGEEDDMDWKISPRLPAVIKQPSVDTDYVTPARQGRDFNILLLETEAAADAPYSDEGTANRKNIKLGWLGRKIAAHLRFVAAAVLVLGTVVGPAVRKRSD